MGEKRITREELEEKAFIDTYEKIKPVDRTVYESSEWRKLKKSYVKDHQLCELCMQEGKEATSRVVHHIIPLAKHGSLLSLDNLIALCKDCHSDIHAVDHGIRIDLGLGERMAEMEAEHDYSRWLPDRGFVSWGKTGKTKLLVLRQDTLAKCKKGEPLKLIRFPFDAENPNKIIGVFRTSGEEIGHIDRKVAICSGLDFEIDHGVEVEAKMLEITGEAGKLECVIGIKRGKMDWQRYDLEEKEAQREKKKLRKKQTRAENAISEAKSSEKTNPDKAVSKYRKAMQILKEIDQDSKHAGKYRDTWRHVRHPINRLTLILERRGKYKECLEEISKYEQSQDILGLAERDAESLRKRKERIMRKRA